MRFGIRKEVDLNNIGDSLTEDLRGIQIELALPYKLEDYLAGRERLPQLKAHIKALGIKCQSVHAAQGGITEDDFSGWGLETARLADELSAEVVVFHPDNCKKERKGNLQIIVLQRIRALQRETGAKVAIETFGGSKRVLTPEDIISKNLPMVLDTSHLLRDRTMDAIEKYHSNIASVHLSEERFDGHEGRSMPHMPVEGFGFEVLDRLALKGWKGVVTLEYLPWHHNRLLPDREMLERKYGGYAHGV